MNKHPTTQLHQDILEAWKLIEEESMWEDDGTGFEYMMVPEELYMDFRSKMQKFKAYMQLVGLEGACE